MFQSKEWTGPLLEVKLEKQGADDSIGKRLNTVKKNPVQYYSPIYGIWSGAGVVDRKP